MKMIIFTVLMYWLYTNDQFNVENIKLGISNINIALIFLCLTLVQLFLAAIRTKTLMQFNRKNNLHLKRVFSITWASLFVNCVVPAAFFGDLYKIRGLMEVDTTTSKDNPIYSSIFSKLFSIFSLLLISMFASFFLEPAAWMHGSLMIIIYLLILLGSIIYLLRSQIVIFLIRFVDKVYTKTNKEFYLRRLNNFKKYNSKMLSRENIFLGLFTSLLIQVLNISSFLLIIYTINPELSLNMIQLICIIPFGIFIMQIPISFSGLGVGHITFGKLLGLYGISNGADIFSIYFVFSYLFNLMGLIPFLNYFRKRELIIG